MDHALPPEDRDRSPHTGWTRDHWAALADRMLAAVEPYRSPGQASVDLPGPASRNGAASDGLEGFARTFLLAGFRVRGEDGADPGNLLERYAAGLAAGTDPRSPEAWPRPDELDQAKVEAASIALVLQLTRPWLWDRLDEPVRARVLDWLGAVVGQPYPPINWVWFRVVVESFLREAGGPWSAADIAEDLAVHASLRRSGGWLSDGPERAYDHYTGWALHLYPLLWDHLFDVSGTLCPEPLRRRWADDLSAYLADAVRLVGADGSPLLQGRSLTYRFAAAAPLWTAAVTGTGGLPPGLLRRAASGMLRHFAGRGALEPGGLLSLGWFGPWPAIRQAYSGPGSPYWAAKGMLGLMLPARHPVWTAVEEPLPVEEGDVARVVRAPGWLVSARRHDGIALVLNHGTDHAEPDDDCADSPLYARLGYSTATLPPLTGPTTADPLDGSVVVLDGAGRATHRSGMRTLFAASLPGGVLAAASRSRVRWVDASRDGSPDHGSGRRGPTVPGPLLTLASLLRGGLEIRLARLDPAGRGDAAGRARAAGGAAGGTDTAGSPAWGSWQGVRLGGWPVTADTRPEARSARPRVGAAASAEAVADGLRSYVRDLGGFEKAGVAAEEGTSPLGRWTATPWLGTSRPPSPGRVLAAAVLLTRDAAGFPEPRVSVTTLAEGAHEITVTWPDGLRTALVLPGPDDPGAMPPAEPAGLVTPAPVPAPAPGGPEERA